MESSDSDSMGFDDDDNGSDLLSNTTLGDDITAQLAAAGYLLFLIQNARYFQVATCTVSSLSLNSDMLTSR